MTPAYFPALHRLRLSPDVTFNHDARPGPLTPTYTTADISHADNNAIDTHGWRSSPSMATGLIPMVTPANCTYPDCQRRLCFQRITHGGVVRRTAITRCPNCRRDAWILLRQPSTEACSGLPDVGTAPWYRWTVVSTNADNDNTLTLRFGDRNIVSLPTDVGDRLRARFQQHTLSTFPCWSRATALNGRQLRPHGIPWNTHESDLAVAILATLTTHAQTHSVVTAHNADSSIDIANVTTETQTHPVPAITWHISVSNLRLHPGGTLALTRYSAAELQLDGITVHLSTWASHAYLAEPPRYRPFMTITEAPCPPHLRRSAPGIMRRDHSAFTPTPGPLHADGIRALPHLTDRYPDMPTLVGTALYGLPMFTDVPHATLAHNEYSGTRAIPWDDIRLQALIRDELNNGSLVNVSQCVADGVIHRTHPTSTRLKPANDEQGNALPDHALKLRQIDDYSFQATDGDNDISVNNGCTTTELPPIRVCAVSDVVDHILHLDAAATPIERLDPVTLFKVDAQSAYRHVQTMAAHVWMTCTTVELDNSTITVADRCTPFGRKDAAAAFCMFGNACTASAQRRGVSVFIYSDDANCIARSQIAIAQRDIVLDNNRRAGLNTNMAKLRSREGTPHPDQPILGVTVNAQTLTMSVTAARRLKLVASIEDVLHRATTALPDLRSLAHKLLFVAECMPASKPTVQPVFHCYNAEIAAAPTAPLHRRTTITTDARHALTFWLEALEAGTCQCSFRPNLEPVFPNAIAISDAAGIGFGSVETRTLLSFSGRWTALELKLPITQREMLAVVFGIFRYAHIACRHHVDTGPGHSQSSSTATSTSTTTTTTITTSIAATAPSPGHGRGGGGLRTGHSCNARQYPLLLAFCDNNAVVNAFSRGFSPDPTLAFLLYAAARVQLQARFTVTVCHISGANNSVTDALSRFLPVPLDTPVLELATLPLRVRTLLDARLRSSSSPANTVTPARRTTPRGDVSLSSALSLVPTHSARVLHRTRTAHYCSTSSPGFDNAASPPDALSHRLPCTHTTPVFAPSWASNFTRLCLVTQPSGRLSVVSHRSHIVSTIESLFPLQSSATPSPTALETPATTPSARPSQ